MHRQIPALCIMYHHTVEGKKREEEVKRRAGQSATGLGAPLHLCVKGRLMINFLDEKRF